MWIKYAEENSQISQEGRIPIYIRLVDGYAHISYLCYDRYTDDSFLFSSAGYPYNSSAAVPYNVQNRRTIEKQTAELVKAVVEAIDRYYEYNGFKPPERVQTAVFREVKL